MKHLLIILAVLVAGCNKQPDGTNVNAYHWIDSVKATQDSIKHSEKLREYRRRMATKYAEEGYQFQLVYLDSIIEYGSDLQIAVAYYKADMISYKEAKRKSDFYEGLFKRYKRGTFLNDSLYKAYSK